MTYEEKEIALFWRSRSELQTAQADGDAEGVEAGLEEMWSRYLHTQQPRLRRLALETYLQFGGRANLLTDDVG